MAIIIINPSNIILFRIPFFSFVLTFSFMMVTRYTTHFLVGYLLLYNYLNYVSRIRERFWKKKKWCQQTALWSQSAASAWTHDRERETWGKVSLKMERLEISTKLLCTSWGVNSSPFWNVGALKIFSNALYFLFIAV